MKFLKNRKLLPGMFLVLLILIPLLYLCQWRALSDASGSSGTVKQETGNVSDTDSSSVSSGVEAPIFSKESGFYDDSFELTIEVPEGTTVYYTTDSSTPSKQSQKYSESIRVEDPSEQESVFSVRTDFEPYRPTPLYEGQEAVYPGFYTRYLLPEGNVDKCAVIRAIAVDQDGNTSPVTTASYFIGYKNKTGYSDVSVMSLVSDPDGLFSDESGIMVNGSVYKEKLESGALDGLMSTHDLRDYTNTYAGRGKEWERETHLDYFGEDGQDLIFSQEIGLRLHGNQSRVGQSQKSFNIYAREEYDGNDTFLSSFFHDGTLSDTVTLMRGNDLFNFYLSDQMDGRTMDAQNYHMVQVFLDGEYWGFYAIQERYASKEYMKTHYNLEKGEYSVLSGTSTGYNSKIGNKNATKTSFKMLKNYIKSHDASDEKVYQKICSMMDVQSFIDCYAARIYTGDQDWSWYKNQYLALYDNKWHWMIYDMDYGVGRHEKSVVSVNTFTSPRLISTESLANDPFFPYLMKNEQFCQDFVNTFMDLANDTFASSKLKKDRKSFMEKYGDATELSINRYPETPGNPSTGLGANSANTNIYDESLDMMEDYFEERYGYASGYLKDYFGLSGSLKTVTLKTEDSSGGSISLNTITPTLRENGTWSGQYFTDYPVSVTASPKEGYEFAGWKCESGEISDATELSAKVTFSSDVTITAIFKKADSGDANQ